jgi:crotonobetainyl-CoA:carnitine CoA-transferase CaiB-like acyl-CoA transferase
VIPIAFYVDYAWQLTNRNKRGIALDLKNPAARDVLEASVKWADVFVTNSPPRAQIPQADV